MLSQYCSNLSACGLGSELVQQPVFRAPTNNTNLFDTLASHLLKVFEYEAVLECKAFQDGAYVFAGLTRNGLVCPGAELIDCGEHVGRTQEGFVIWIDEMAERRLSGRQFHQFAILVKLTLCCP